ncbi:unnamed protein product [Cuscuta campestris]|uniref:Uncharacterized protein n=1 Tax=Cuscuta campestris TaxID=132261 RepID=A0A484MJM5_9ASTE|nr:unnamed protein product [Cuscuta campestris]
MQTRYMERSGSMAREKRPLNPSCTEEAQPPQKRPALASVIVEALKVDSMQKLCSSLEPILRRVVSEEVERALAKLCPAKHNSRVSPERIEGPDGRSLQLQFRSKLSLPLFTGGKIEGEQGSAIHVVLLDGKTGRVVTSGPESSVKLDIIVLEGDFDNEDEEGWSQEEFESHIVKEREGKRPLLTGDLQVTLKEGVGTLGELTFTDNSSWIRSRKFRLGVKVAHSGDYCEKSRIREAKTEAFTVKDHRGELYKKHYPPSLNDEVWRLEKIGKDGSFHKRLNKSGIYTVEDFLRLVVRDTGRLRSILGSGMSNKMWDTLVEHAKTCVLSGKLYVYYADDTRNVGVVFNNVYELCGLIAGGNYRSIDSLSESQKVYVDGLVKKAYDNWMHVIEYDGKSLLILNDNKNSVSIPNGPILASQNHSYSFPNHQNLPTLPSSTIPSKQLRAATGPPHMGGYNDSSSWKFATQSHHNMNHINDPFENQSVGTSRQTVVAVSRFPQTSQSFQTPAATSNFACDNNNNFLTEEEIRLRSHEMLENEEMQHLLRVFSMGGGHYSHAFNNNKINNHDSDVSEEGCYRNPNDPYALPSEFTGTMMSPLPNVMPSLTFGYGEEYRRPRSSSSSSSSSSSGKAVVGWLKLKAALRWGIFIRKKAAERRRAQIIELDDDDDL